MAGSRKKHKSTQKTPYHPFLTLVAEDGIEFRFLAASGVGSSPTDPVWIMRTFRRAFNDVWQRIPCADRQLMLHYWRHTDPALTGRPPLARSPLIEIQEIYAHEPSRPFCEHFAHKLTFPTDLIVRRAATLPHEIAGLLVCVLRYANREFWRLYMEMVDQPYNNWEAGEGAEASENACDCKYAELERNYLPAYHAAVARTLHQWGFEGAELEISTE
jgi:hypothetical protein